MGGFCYLATGDVLFGEPFRRISQVMGISVMRHPPDTMTRFHLVKLSAAIAIPVVVLFFLVLEQTGVLDHATGLDDVLDVARRMETSYAPGVDRQVGPDEPSWPVLLDLISSYSAAEMPADRTPELLARSVAISSGKVEIAPGQIAEWTAPSTPIMLIYSDPSGDSVPSSNVRVVGTISDLRAWVDRRRSDRKFLFVDLVLAVLAIAFAALVWWTELPRDTVTGRGDS